MEIRHKPVLLEETMSFLAPQGGELIVDGTTGEGGHSEAFLMRFPSCKLVCLDADPTIQEKAKKRLAPFSDRIEFVLTWFDEFFENYSGEIRPNVILLDLGISVFHYEESGRGFTFRADEPLDMRLNPDSSDSAADLVNGLAEEELARIFFEYGEESFSRRIARAIVTSRKKERVESSKKLADIIWEAVPASYRHSRLHPATKSFQALRIAVNAELERLESTLHSAFGVLNVGGRMGVITFHSLEDRAVKTFFREQAKACICPPSVARCQCGGKPLAADLTRKPIVASEEEVAENSPSRSAKLRVVKKLRETRRDL